ncbi:hypothetical protein B0A48_10064 [Cryoendolithus antarcticus]|uniref:F-box domain-containing protein n=1 Tax=Cryoendolithus antarcticus TaxID=1507870 RepID=A0A1V8T418_9PEZI|nr:hypothetical protein B0A48_10064 [Cryoendolithus antarcticus]
MWPLPMGSTLSSLSSDEEASTTPTAILTEPPARRLRNLFTRRPGLNPRANDFMPTSSNKRKKTTSPTRAVRANVAPASSTDPVLSAHEIFAGVDIPTQPDANLTTVNSVAWRLTEALSDDETMPDDMAALLDGAATAAGSTHARAALSLLASRSNSAGATLPDPGKLRVAAAILIEGTGQDQTLDDENIARSSEVAYLPLASTTSTGAYHIPKGFKILPPLRRQLDHSIHQSTSSVAVWPRNELPMEIFELITRHLARTDVRSLRLVNREFEQKVSPSLFHTAVVPFNTELYDMMAEEVKKKDASATRYGKSKGKARETPESALQWKNATTDREGKVYKGHGLRVFEGFGPHIKRFGMSFEVTEAQLAHPPEKRKLDPCVAYHGAYDWPPPQYLRFSNLAGLERTADETSRMKAAFSKLVNVQEIGLSIDSGLGRLNGADVSPHTMVHDHPLPVFSAGGDAPPDHTRQAKKQFWTTLQRSQQSIGRRPNAKETSLHYADISAGLHSINGFCSSDYSSTVHWPRVDARGVLGGSRYSGASGRTGVAYLLTDQDEKSFAAPVNPCTLRKEQIEWLLETEWAQRAFLESYMLAVMDNPSVFSKVTKLNVVKISSGLLSILGRVQLWAALPALEDVTLCVSPDWRCVQKDTAGYAEAPAKSPSLAVQLLYGVLRQIQGISHVKHLTCGFTDGGEKGTGVLGRNNNLLPAPILPLQQCLAMSPTGLLDMTYLEQLTLVNCWITPPALEALYRRQSHGSLQVLKFDSVSLTASPRATPPAGAPAQAAALAHAHLQHAALAVPAGGWGAQAPLQVPAPQLVLPQPAAWLPAIPVAPVPNANALAGLHGINHLPAIVAPFANAVVASGLLGNTPPAQAAGIISQLWLRNRAQWVNYTTGLVVPASIAQFIATTPGLTMASFVGHVNMHNHPNLAGPAVPAPAHQHHYQPLLSQQPSYPTIRPDASTWTSNHRDGSWPDLIDKLSPGPAFDDYLPQPQPWESQRDPRPEVALKKLIFTSCGYVRLPANSNLDQTAVHWDVQHPIHSSAWFRQRQRGLAGAAQTSQDIYLGKLTQFLPPAELNAMFYAWGMTAGWDDVEAAEAAEYDGQLKGGSGRFSGTVERGMELRS